MYRNLILGSTENDPISVIMENCYKSLQLKSHEPYGVWVYAHWISADDRQSDIPAVYFGRTVNLERRWKDHVNLSATKTRKRFPFQCALAKYGIDKFQSICLPVDSWRSAGRLESECIWSAGQSNFYIYNQTKGNDGTCDIDYLLTTSRYQEMCKMFDDGKSFHDIAEFACMHYSTAIRQLAWPGRFPYPRPTNGKKSYTRSDRHKQARIRQSQEYRMKEMNTDQFKLMLKLHEQGKSYAQISRELGIHPDKVRNRIRWIYPDLLSRSKNSVPRKSKI